MPPPVQVVVQVAEEEAMSLGELEAYASAKADEEAQANQAAQAAMQAAQFAIRAGAAAKLSKERRLALLHREFKANRSTHSISCKCACAAWVPVRATQRPAPQGWPRGDGDGPLADGRAPGLRSTILSGRSSDPDRSADIVADSQ